MRTTEYPPLTRREMVRVFLRVWIGLQAVLWIAAGAVASFVAFAFWNPDAYGFLGWALARFFALVCLVVSLVFVFMAKDDPTIRAHFAKRREAKKEGK